MKGTDPFIIVKGPAPSKSRFSPSPVAGAHVLGPQLDGKPFPDPCIGVRRDVRGVVLRKNLVHALVRPLVDGRVARLRPGSGRQAVGQLWIKELALHERERLGMAEVMP